MANRVLEPAVAALALEIGQQIVRARERRKITQADVGAKSGISTKNLNKYEHGRLNATIEQLLKIAKGLDADLKIEFVLRGPNADDRSM